MKKLITTIIGNKEKIETERYFLTIVLFTGSIFLLIFCVAHMLMKLQPGPVYIASGSSVILIGLYFFTRLKGCLQYPKLLLTIWGLAILDLIFYTKYLSMGPGLLFIMLFSALIIWLWEGRSLIIMLLLYFVNMAFLFYLEYKTPQDLLIYPGFRIRSIDIFVSFLLLSSLMIALLYAVKKEYIRQREKAVKSDRLKSLFLANMSHEIRTPMNAIIGFSRLLSKEKSKDKRNNYINLIQKSSESLLRLINDIINLSKIESGDIEINYSYFKVEQLFSELKELYAIELSKADKTDIHLDFKLTDRDICIRTDYVRLKQVLSNLLNNAIKFTEQGKIMFSCKKKKDELLFSVSDTGIGIPEDEQDTIFEQFYNINYQNLNVDGTGIGLAIVERIVKLLNGKIWITSFPGWGSTFNFTIPYETEEVMSLPAEKPLPEIVPSEKKLEKSILVVEDDEMSSLLLTSVLNSMNYKYHHVKNGLEAVEYFRKNPDIPVILMDMKLPVMDGYEAVGKIKEINPSVIVLAQTAFAFSDDKQKALDAGCDDYLSKPINFQELNDMLQKYL